ncbi:hypothetical protein BC351_00815 [Paenibacillus ferrarius]|uniref:Uncharacterized protein n=1 Tax=Paenibacillus ferrarius TaxID=1469647 RepID=A0A1V4HS97_9BACL|nr:hypothetical protein [Paenibacillus ferrarius]OPH61814.1 hypothetical protein BC351_00815 [Paenibacillus ferrarius]
MSKLPSHTKVKIEQYMKHSHKANKLRNEIDEWFVSKGIDTIGTDENDSNGGSAIQDVIVDAAQGTETTEEQIENTIKLIEINYFPIK